MPHWNQWSEEVRKERDTVRAYGVDKIMDRVREPDSYKGQALRQLAMRLELEEVVRQKDAEINRLVDQLEALEHKLWVAQNPPKPED